jgi:hypothetical protein
LRITTAKTRWKFGWGAALFSLFSFVSLF